MVGGQDRPERSGPSAKAIAFIARDGRVVHATPSFVAALCGERAGVLGHLDDLPAALARALTAQVIAALEGGASASELELHLGPLDERWIAHAIAIPTAPAAEAMATLVLERASSTGEEANRRLRAEDALRLSEHRFQQIAETIKDVFFITDLAGPMRLLYVNPAFETVYGRSAQPLYDDLTRLMESVHPEDAEHVLDVFKGSIGIGHDLVYRILRPDGSVVWVHDRGYPVRAPDGTMMVCGLVTDITAERRLREELVQAQKLESIGRLAGGIAHDFNNILTVVLTCADIASSMLPAASPVQEELGNIRLAGERAAALTHQLLAFARRQVIRPARVDVNQLARDMRAMLGRLIGEGIQLEMRLLDQPAIAWVDQSQLEQVVLNLAVNARDAMSNGGRLAIAISMVAVGASASTEHEGLVAGDYVCLAVEDEGEGIAPAHRAHIFEPFFTTKGRGGGLGLATSHGIVAQAGGRIVVQSEVGKGAVFEVLLPRVPSTGDDDGAKPHAAPSPGPTGGETILLVEDQPPVRKAAATILRSRGYQVIEASDGIDALDVASNYEGTIQLLLTDVVMPRMGGVELAERLLVLRPAIKVLLTSGFTEGADLRISSDAGFLPKPYVMETLLAKVRDMLGHG